MKNRKFLSNCGALISGLALYLLLLTPAHSVNVADPEWPCIQAYVPEVAIAVVWPEPVDDSIAKAWRKDERLKKIVRDFGSLETISESDRDRLGEFAESIAEADRIDVLNKAASGIVEQFNRRRSDYVRGIRKFTRQQIAVAKQIEGHLNELATLSNRTDEESVSKRVELEETTAWQQRIFDKRERTIGLLCDAPVEVESVMGDVLRELAQYLP